MCGGRIHDLVSASLVWRAATQNQEGGLADRTADGRTDGSTDGRAHTHTHARTHARKLICTFTFMCFLDAGEKESDAIHSIKGLNEIRSRDEVDGCGTVEWTDVDHVIAVAP